jgi:hypothetical protein
MKFIRGEGSVTVPCLSLASSESAVEKMSDEAGYLLPEGAPRCRMKAV